VKASLTTLLVVGLLAGCSGFSPSEDQLPDSTFTQVLTELHLARARAFQDTTAWPIGLRDSIFARHNVQPEAFDATLQHYSRHPKAFETLYQSVVDTLQSLRYTPTRPSRSEESPDSLSQRQRRRDASP
jgi:hypothetical protein